MRILSTKHKYFLIIEFMLLCIGLPTLIIVNKWAPNMFLFLWGAALYCTFHLHIKSTEGFAKRLWKWEAVNIQNLKTILPRWILASFAMFVFLYFYDPSRLFNVIEHRPYIIPMILFGYPLLSALPQELIFCSFFFHRYQPFFKTDMSRIIASAIVFAYAHVLYINWVAPLLSLIAGLIFAETYAKTRSLALVTLEHSLYGISLFMIGLGWYFWGGAVATAR